MSTMSVACELEQTDLCSKVPLIPLVISSQNSVARSQRRAINSTAPAVLPTAFLWAASGPHWTQALRFR